MIEFSVSALEKSPVTLRGPLPAEFLSFPDGDIFSAAGEGRYELTASRVSGGVLVSGRISAPVAAFCSRCLKELQLTVAAEDLRVFFELAEGQEILSADEDVRSELLLNLPMNPLCSPECRGLCPRCGGDLNAGECRCGERDEPDPASPWNALNSLKL